MSSWEFLGWGSNHFWVKWVNVLPRYDHQCVRVWAHFLQINTQQTMLDFLDDRKWGKVSNNVQQSQVYSTEITNHIASVLQNVQYLLS